MKTARQVEAAELMVAANNFTVAYARALFMASPDDQLLSPRPKKSAVAIPENERLHMEKEMKNLTRDMKEVEKDYGENVVRLVVANGYITRLLANENVTHFLIILVQIRSDIRCDRKGLQG